MSRMVRVRLFIECVLSSMVHQSRYLHVSNLTPVHSSEYVLSAAGDTAQCDLQQSASSIVDLLTESRVVKSVLL